MEQTSNKAYNNERHDIILKLLPYVEMPLKKSMRKQHIDTKSQSILKETREEFKKIFKSIPSFEKGYNRNGIATIYAIAFIKINRKYGYLEDFAIDLLLDGIDIGVNKIPMILLGMHLNKSDLNFLKNIKINGIRKAIKQREHEMGEIKLKRKQEIVNTIIRKQHLEGLNKYLEIFTFI